MDIVGYILAIFVGITLGLIGGGGSILTVPILVYFFKINPEIATSYSLFIVGMTALFGSYRHYEMGNLNLKIALTFALSSVTSLLIVRNLLLPLVPKVIFSYGDFIITKQNLIMLIFSGLMIMASFSMIKPKETSANQDSINYLKLFNIGILVGFVTGFLGAGGGFLIIPALIYFAGLSMKKAVGTSLFIIFINSMIGFVGDIIAGYSFDYTFLAIITSIAFVGMIIGTYLSKQINGNKLKPIFGWFILIMGFYIIVKEISSQF